MNCKTQKPEFRMIECSISNLGKVVTGKTPSTKNSLFWEGDIPFITPKDIQKTKHIFDTERNLTFEGMKSVKNCVLPENAICVSCIGNIGYVAKTTSPAVTNQQINSIIVNDANNSDYVYYLMRSLWQRFKNYEGQSTTLSILNKRQFSEIKILIHEDKAVQTKIANVLSSLDNKIELNEKINQNLEAQAQAIFKSWFVDFEPFGGKMPADWGQGCLSDVLSVIESGSRPKGGSESSGVPSIGAENIDGIGHYDYSKEKYINRDFFQNLRHGKVNSGDILLYKDGAYVGKVSMALNGFPHEICAVNEHVFILRTNERLPSQSYLYLFFAQHSIRNKIATLGSAKAAQPGVNQSDIKGISLTIPNKGTIQAFENIASSLFFKIVQNSIQSRRLAQLRDTLLPKLMSGEIDVSEVAV